jgi:hypothetical protein
MIDRTKLEQLYYWLAMERMMEQFLISGEVACPVQGFCPYKAPLCTVEPWKMRINGDGLCIYNQVYRCLGLAETTLVSGA